MEGVDGSDARVVQVGEDVAQQSVEVVVSVGAAFRGGEEGRDVTATASEAVAFLDVADS